MPRGRERGTSVNMGHLHAKQVLLPYFEAGFGHVHIWTSNCRDFGFGHLRSGALGPRSYLLESGISLPSNESYSTIEAGTLDCEA